MANTLTNLAADIYLAADKVGRERIGLIPSVTINSGSERAAKGDTVRSHFTRAQSVNETDTPSMTIPQGDDQTVDSKTLTIDKYASVQIPWTGEDIKHVNNGSGFETIYGDQIQQAMRTISNKIEANGILAAYVASSRAVGTAGTAPFGSNFDLVADARKILVDNGCVVDDGQISLVMNTTAGANLRKLAQLQKANEADGTALLRQGILLDLLGVMLRESGQIAQHVKGAGTGYDVNNGSGEAIGQTTLTLDGGTVNSTGFKAGDVVTHASDATNKYIVGTGLTATTGDIILNNPGLLIAAADTDELTIGNSYTPALMFHRSAIELAIRAPALPNGGDAASDIMVVQDPWSGLVFEVAAYKGYRKAMIEVRTVYGWKAWKSESIATILG
jgi:hypothetical protein